MPLYKSLFGLHIVYIHIDTVDGKTGSFLNNISDLFNYAFNNYGNVNAIGHNNMKINKELAVNTANLYATVKLVANETLGETLNLVFCGHAGNAIAGRCGVANQIGKVFMAYFDITVRVF
jgi:hypothetical protein